MDMHCAKYAPLRCVIRYALRDVSIFIIIPPTMGAHVSANNTNKTDSEPRVYIVKCVCTFCIVYYVLSFQDDIDIYLADSYSNASRRFWLRLVGT
jgi:hypothetical protein